MALLQKAVAGGYKDVKHLQKAPEFEPLRSRGDFKKLLAKLASGEW